VEVYEELARIFSEENNQSAQRELLMKEGTAKFAETAGENDRQMLKVIQKQASHSNVSFSFFFSHFILIITNILVFFFPASVCVTQDAHWREKTNSRLFIYFSLFFFFQNNSL
jgi:hypothetical protein